MYNIYIISIIHSYLSPNNIKKIKLVTNKSSMNVYSNPQTILMASPFKPNIFLVQLLLICIKFH